MVPNRTIIAVVLSALMLTSAGCAGWGEDGPANPEEETDGNGEAQEDVDPADDDEDDSVGSGDNEQSTTEPDETPQNESDGDDSEGPGQGSSDNEQNTTESNEIPQDESDGDDSTDGTTETDESDGDDQEDSEPSEEGDENATSGNGDGEDVYTLSVEADSPVTLERTWEDASTTREPTDGTVEFSVVPGDYALSAEGYADISEESPLSVEEDTTFEMQSTDGGTIEVTVVDAETGDGIEGAEISGGCSWYYSSGDAYISGETDSDGVAQAQTELSPTSCDATIDANGYEGETVPIDVPDDDGRTVELEPEGDDGDE